MRLLRLLFTISLLVVCSSSFAVESYAAIEKSQVIVFINGKKYYIHTVKSGDTLYSIAKLYGVNEATIKECNPSASDGLKIDQSIKIPVSEKALEEARAEKKRKKDFLSYKIKAGQTLYAIARDFNISVSTLREDNPSINPQSLPVGETLWIRRSGIGSSSEEEAKEEIAQYTETLNKAADDGYEYYVVQAGETIYSLTRKHGITEAEFAQLNDVSNGLKAGAMVRFPKPKQVEQPEAVQPEAETAEQIAEGENIIFRSLEPSQKLNIALMLPLKVEGKPNASYVEFYQGFMLGMEQLKQMGKGDSKLTVYNTEHNQMKVQHIVESQHFQGTNLVVGPVYEDELKPVLQYAHTNSVPVVSPLANISAVKSSALYCMAPDPEKKYEKVASLFDGGRDIYLIYAASHDKEFEQEVLKVLEGRPYAAYTYSFNQKSIFTPRNAEARAIEQMDDILKEEKPCLFIVLANKETDVDRILGTISSAKVAITERSEKCAQYVVLGTSRWGKFDNIDHTSYFNNNVVMISTYHAKRDSEAIRKFDSRYIEAYRTLPSLYAYRGYDAAIIFASGMYSDMDYNMLDKRYTPLQTTYKFYQKHEGDKYINQEWIRVNYNSNYTITLE